jgi:pyruvate, orthophosphate dikinase
MTALQHKQNEAIEKHVYLFGGGTADGNASMKNILGGKGANLAEMCALGLPVPPGFTIATDVCLEYFKNGNRLSDAVRRDVTESIKIMEAQVGALFGNVANPLLVSIRSGARASMPGMMDTVLNLGLNDKTVEGLAEKSDNPRFAYDSYRRFIQMYADVVLGVDHYYFEDLLDSVKLERGAMNDTDLTADDLRELVDLYKDKVQDVLGQPFPQDCHVQLWGAIEAVFSSWMNKRAITYRTLNNIPESWGTAVNVQVMVFGNMGSDCATGVAFTRNPSTGAKEYYGEFLINAQGEDVVAGIRTPQPLTKQAGAELPSMQEAMPEVYQQLADTFEKLEKHYRDVQDIEFTVQNNKLWLLQTRNGKRTAQAAVKIAVDMAHEGIITKEEALLRVDALMLDQLLHPTLDPNAKKTVITRGLPASPGAASGSIVFTSEEAERRAKLEEAVILVRIETSPEDIQGMHSAEGIITARGGMTSHAAVVARGMGKPCICGASALHINYEQGSVRIGTYTLQQGDIVTIDGATGEIILGEVPTKQPDLSGDFNQLMAWADAVRTLGIRTNADNAHDATTARYFGAEGIGLCRTEHMFFEGERIIPMREMILAETKTQREHALKALLPIQRADFAALFKAMRGLPVTIRLLDPPLHEFLPHTEAEMQEVADISGISLSRIRDRAHALKEANPMLGHRGCRLAVTYPEIYEMQTRAILEAALHVMQHDGDTITPEIMVPLIVSNPELEFIKRIIDAVAEEVFAEQHAKLEYHVGTMIELPRAALRAGDIAQTAEFFSFGTNDLTQTTFGMSRDDAGSFIGHYKKAGLMDADPFMSLDVEGVGELVELAAERGRATRANLKLGICGEHGGDPASIRFCQSVGLDYVSCSPYRVPIARLAAAQAALLQNNRE